MEGWLAPFLRKKSYKALFTNGPLSVNKKVYIIVIGCYYHTKKEAWAQNKKYVLPAKMCSFVAWGESLQIPLIIVIETL